MTDCSWFDGEYLHCGCSLDNKSYKRSIKMNIVDHDLREKDISKEVKMALEVIETLDGYMLLTVTINQKLHTLEVKVTI